MKIVKLTILFTIVLQLHLLGQVQLKHEAKLFIDSTGQVFTRVDAPAYFFISPADSAENLTLIPSDDKHANPMMWDGHGSQYIVYRDLKQNMNIRFKIVADGISPKSKPLFTKGLLFNYDNTFFSEVGSEMTITATDAMTGVDCSYFSTDENPFQKADHPITFNNEGEFYVKAYSVDNVGNAEEINEYRIVTTNSASIQLSNIYFGLGSTELISEAANELSKLVNLLQTYKDIHLEIRAHTDSRGEANYNLFLSEGRAQSVIRFLKSKGIAEHRLSAKGYGESQLVNECSDGVACPDEKHKANRRVELIVTKSLP